MNAFVQHPDTPADYADNLRAARVAVAGPLGLAIVNGTPGELATLSQADQIRLLDEVATFIVANQGLFSIQQIETARRRTNQPSFRVPVETSPALLDQAAEFVKAYGESFGETFEGAAGIVGRSVKALGFNVQTIAVVAAVGAILWFGAPYVVPKLRDAFTKK